MSEVNGQSGKLLKLAAQNGREHTNGNRKLNGSGKLNGNGAAAISQDLQFDVHKVLGCLGLSSPEILVYLAALESGSRPASVIAKRAKLKRGQTYNALSALSQRGIVQEFLKNGTRHFVPSKPDSLVTMVENRETELAQQKQKLQELIPQLKRFTSGSGLQSKVRFFQGFEGVKEIYEDTLRLDPGSELFFFVGDEHGVDAGDELRQWLNTYVERRNQRRILAHVISLRTPSCTQSMVERPSTHRKNKYLTTGYDIPVEVIIYGSKVAVVSVRNEMVGLVVESVNISDAFRNMYRIAWGVLPDYQVGAAEESVQSEPT